jgi:cytochrome c-type biogenesis protein CcmH
MATDPQNLNAKRELALVLLSAGRFFEAFTLANEVLADSPNDPSGLFVQGVVRLTMGQSDAALELFDRLLAEQPDNLQALLYRGLSQYQLGNVEQAIDSWEMGLEMAGGSDPDFEEVLAMARAGAEVPAGPFAPVPSQPATAPAVDTASYPLQIELPAGSQSAVQATLFVFLRAEEGGPPVAVKRVVNPSFPLQLTLGEVDSMIGDELPDSGIMVARLDADGSVTTTDAADLQAQAVAEKGIPTRLVLAGAGGPG